MPHSQFGHIGNNTSDLWGHLCGYKEVININPEEHSERFINMSALRAIVEGFVVSTIYNIFAVNV